MNLENILITITICIALLPVIAVMRRVQVRRWQAITALLGMWLVFPALLLVTATNYSTTDSDVDRATNRPIEVLADQYVGSKTCRSCHPREHATWHASYHRTMTQVANTASVISDVHDFRVSEGQKHCRLMQKGDDFWVEMDLPLDDSSPAQMRRHVFPIVMVTGSHHMQVYWFTPNDQSRYLAMVPYIYLADEDRWIPRSAAFLEPPKPSLGIQFGPWNEICIRCHTTRGQMGLERFHEEKGPLVYDFFDVDSRVAEFGIACEACHGPGQEHVRANRDPTRRYRHYLSNEPDETITHPLRLSHQLSSQVCGQCHASTLFRSVDIWKNWVKHGYLYRPGDDLSESHMRMVVQCSMHPLAPRVEEVLQDDPGFLEGIFWSDGMVRVSGREYNGLIESPCYKRGKMSCFSCHQMHQAVSDPRPTIEWANDQLKVDMDGNLACIQCHDRFGDQKLLSNHTHHAADSTGSLCYNCHMPYTTYGLLKAIRSHQVDTPSVGVSVTTGRPNACNQCHLDKTLAWAADHLNDWYAIEIPDLDEDQTNVAASVSWLLRGDAGQRALMAWSYGWKDAQECSGDQWMAPYLAQLLEDPYDAVRFIAQRSLRGLRGFKFLKEQYDFVGPANHRAGARGRVLEKWTQMQKRRPDLQGRPELLIDDDGNLVRERFDRLLKQRDDRVVDLQE